MGVFYYIHSVALIEDLPLLEHYNDPNEFYTAADAAYSQVCNRTVNTLSVYKLSSRRDDS